MTLPRLRTALYVAEAAWVVALLGAMAALRSAAESASRGPSEGGSGFLDAPYLALLLPFAVIHYAGVRWPAVARILGVPVGHLVSLAIVYVLFSGGGVLSTAFAVDISGMFAALIVAVVLSYAAMVLRHVAKLEVAERYPSWTANALRALSALAVATAIALVVGVGLGHLPVASAALLDRPGTREFGESSLPFFGGFYESRYAIAASFIDRGTDPEALAVTLIVAHCQRGDDLEDAVDRWFSLVDASDPVPEWLTRPWGPSSTRLRATLRRLYLVNSAIASLCGDATHSELAPSIAQPRATGSRP